MKRSEKRLPFGSFSTLWVLRREPACCTIEDVEAFSLPTGHPATLLRNRPIAAHTAKTEGAYAPADIAHRKTILAFRE
ncbi:hypothetical protein [Cupriavidus sp. UME77]|uniref:hypothetical protein n=1 Tax=Cupriavidus sp. UME77 TaxID=1862321 RepID=UPI00160333FB|nr:hypothetical protein [Cupriavidus sp. UME77]